MIVSFVMRKNMLKRQKRKSLYSGKSDIYVRRRNKKMNLDPGIADPEAEL